MCPTTLPLSQTVNVASNNHLLHVDDVQVLDRVMDRRLPSTLASLYGPHLTCRLAVTHAHLLVKIAETILLLPNYTNLPVSVADLFFAVYMCMIFTDYITAVFISAHI